MWNPAAERIFGWRSDQILGQPQPLVPPELAAEFRELRAHVQGGGTLTHVPAVRRRKDGTDVPVSISAAPLRADDRVVGLIALYTDVSEQKRLEAQFLHAQKMEAVGRLTGGIAHDFNNLLTVICGYSELLMTTLPEEDDARSLVSEIRAAGERAVSLTRQLLAFSRKQVTEPMLLNLNEVVGGMERLIRRLIGEDVDFVTRFAADLGTVRADVGQVEQVIMNLVINARDAMPHGGRLTIETANVELGQSVSQLRREVRPGPYVLLAVSDTGVGMDDATRARIFEPFFTTKEAGKGTGLGLATVYAIVKQSGGYVYAYGELGRGSVFKVYLPRVDATPAPAGRVPHADTATNGGTETVLLVEDDDGLRALTRTSLERHGYQVLEAKDAAAARQRSADHGGRIDLVLTDVILPGTGGPELAAELAVSRAGLKVLYISGYADDAVVRHGVLGPGAAFLQKPFTPDMLARKVREVLDAPAVTR